MTATVFDVAAYILEKNGPLTAMKLQKLVYYSQAWHIAWTDDVLFCESIQAWADGPVCPDLFYAHKGMFRVHKVETGNSSALSIYEKNSIDKVLDYYGDKSPQWLSDLTHMEAPWQEARQGLPDREPSKAEITPDSMLRYYSNL